MKTVELTTDEIAIPVMVKAYLTRNHLIRILADLWFYEEISFPLTKTQAIKEAKMHIKLKGYSVYPDYYEDTDDTPLWNEAVDLAEKYVDKKFPELKEA